MPITGWVRTHIIIQLPRICITLLAEGLRVIVEEGLDNTFARLRGNSETLWSGLEELDMPPFIPLEYRLPPLTTARYHGR